MDGELFRRIYHAAAKVASRTPAPGHTYSDFDVLVTFVHAACNDEPVSWACRRRNWPIWCWRVRVPTPSTLSRRTRTRGFQRLLVRLNGELARELPGSTLKLVDGKALLVGGFSRDPDARLGKAPGGWGRGYKFHAVLNACGAVELFTVTPLDAGEATVARSLLEVGALDLGGPGSLLLADGNYDSNPLYAAAARANGKLRAPRRKPGTGLGHGREQHPHRLQAVDELERTAGGLGQFERLRLGVEQAFGLMTDLGLGALPPWVRRLRRVRLWAMAKVILYHAHLLEQDARRAAADG